MLTNYIRAGLPQAKYKILPDDGTFYGEIPGFQGICVSPDTLEACREELDETSQCGCPTLIEVTFARGF